jgi:hypothetical protein
MNSDNYEFSKSSAPQSTSAYSPYTDKQFNYINDINSSECCICYSKYQEDLDNKAVILRCKHIFHDECIKTYLSTYSSKCPECRTDIRNK